MSSNISLGLTRISNTVTIVISYTDPSGAAKTTTISTLVPDSTPAPTATLTVSPASIVKGRSTTIAWTSTNATTTTGTNFSTGGKLSGSLVVSPTINTTYSITCTGVNGSVTTSTSIIVIQPVAPTVSLTASSQSITAGQSTTLAWTSTNATSTTGTNFSTASALLGSIVVSPTTNTTYSISAIGTGGTAIVNVSITVTQPILPTVALTISPTSVSAGQSATIAWSTTNTTSTMGTNFSTGGATSGTLVVSESATTIYSIVATGANGVANASATLTFIGPSNCMNLKLVQEQTSTTALPLTKPERGVIFSEPNFGTCMIRATDHTADGLNTFARNDYSRRQPFNADNTLYLVYDHSGSWYTYSQTTHQKVKALPALGGDCEPAWSPTDPALLYWLPTNGGLVMNLLHVGTMVNTVVADFAPVKTLFPTAAHIWSDSEGAPSKDVRYWGFMVQDTNFNILGYITWDIVNNKLVGSMAHTNALSFSVAPDHCSMSPNGKWMVISWDAPNGTWAYPLDFSSRQQVHTASEHSDLCIGANGHDYYVSIDFQSDNGDIFMVDLDTATRTTLIPTYVGGDAATFHISGKAFNKPGWILLGTYGTYGPLPRPWYDAKLFILEMAANPRTYAIGYHRTNATTEYFAEEHPAPNRDFTLINFNSNWGSATSLDIDTYQIILSPTAFP